MVIKIEKQKNIIYLIYKLHNRSLHQLNYNVRKTTV